MLRLLIDKAGDGHHDLFLKIDVMISHIRIADSYFLYDFLHITDEEYGQLKEDERLKYAATKLINYWIDRIRALEKGQRTFLLFDLSDQYIGGLTLEKVKRGYKMKTVYTTEIQGGVVQAKLDEQIAQSGLTFMASDEREWLIGEEALFNGLNWSLNELKL